MDAPPSKHYVPSTYREPKEPEERVYVIYYDGKLLYQSWKAKRVYFQEGTAKAAIKNMHTGLDKSKMTIVPYVPEQGS